MSGETQGGVLRLLVYAELACGLEHARRMFALSTDLVAALADVSARVKATLVVSAVESIGAYVLPSRLAGYERDDLEAVEDLLPGPDAEKK